jgi:hypothetical protein
VQRDLPGVPESIREWGGEHRRQEIEECRSKSKVRMSMRISWSLSNAFEERDVTRRGQLVKRRHSHDVKSRRAPQIEQTRT